MNAIQSNLSPLPRVLEQTRVTENGRRHRIGSHEIDPRAVLMFNDVLHFLDLRRPHLDRDQLATAARELIDHRDSSGHCTRQRRGTGAAIDLMLSDPGWNLPPSAAALAMAVADYLRADSGPIPNAIPVVGRLDDAIVVDTAWPHLADEVQSYLDFCRLRHIEALLADEPVAQLHFGRQDFAAAARAEREWIAHVQRVGQQSYVPAQPPSRFRVN